MVRANYIDDLPGLRIVPASLRTLSVPPKPPHAWPPPKRTTFEQGSTPLRVGPVLRLRMHPHPHMLVKAAAQSLVSDVLRSAVPDDAAPWAAATPFAHHWTLDVTIQGSYTASLHKITCKQESYRLEVSASGGVALTAPTAWGAMHGIRTLRQLLEVRDDNSAWLFPCIIEDVPTHQHRGVLVPHGTPLADLQQWIDHVAVLKYNVLHWPLLMAGEEELPHVLEFVRIITAYAARRGMQTLLRLQIDTDKLNTKELRHAFVERLLAHSQNTSPLVDVDPAHVPRRVPHRVVQTCTNWRTVNDARAVVVLEPASDQEAYEQWIAWGAELAADDGSARMLGASLALPASDLALIQAAALLWNPGGLATSPDDSRLELAARATFPNDSIPSSQPSSLEVESAM